MSTHGPDRDAAGPESTGFDPSCFEELLRMAFEGPSGAGPAEGGPGSSLELSTGQVFDGFELIAPLGIGGMGVVWEALQLGLERRVAIKFIRPEMAGPLAIEYFHREARAGGRLDHPGVVSVLHTGETDGVLWIAQELVEGGTLKEFLASLDPSVLGREYYLQIARIFRDLARALQCAHDEEIVHRDVKPANILLTAGGEPKMSDFGLARLLDESLTGSSLVGTPEYMSPEQSAPTRGGVDHRTDVYALGATFYEALTLTAAHATDPEFDRANRTRHFDPLPPREVEPRVPRDLETICAKAMEPDAGDRFQSMDALADQLQLFLDGEPIEIHPPGPVRKLRKLLRRRREVIARVGASFTIAALVAVLWLTHQEARAAERDGLLSRMQWMVEIDDLEGAAELAKQAVELDPSSPRAPLLLASAFAKKGRIREAETALDEAFERGFALDGPAPETAEGHYHRGLARMVREGRPAYAAAEEDVARAVALDPGLHGAFFTLYQLRKFLGDDGGAGAALARYREGLRVGDDLRPVVEALGYELRGDHDAACRILSELLERPDLDEDAPRRLRLHRHLGRNLLAAGRLAEAERELGQAAADFPDDVAVLTNLAAVHYSRHIEVPALQTLAEIEQFSERALAHDPDRAGAAEHLAFARVMRAWSLQASEDPGSEAARARAEEAMERLRQLEPAPELLDSLDARLLYLEALESQGSARLALFEECIELDPNHLGVGARIELGQSCYFAGDHEGALAHFLEVVSVFDEGLAHPHLGRRMLLVANLWTLGVAGELGEREVARAAAARVEEELDAETECHAEDALNYADFLSASPFEETRDCSRARELVERYALRSAFLADGRQSQVDAILDEIAERCP